MDHAVSRVSRLRLLKFQERIRAVSKGRLSIPDGARRALIGVGLAGLSLLLGLEASRHSEAMALRDWERRNSPSGRIWELAAEEQGFQPVAESKQRHRVLRTLPAVVEELDTTWWHPEGWIASFRTSLGERSPALYGLAGAQGKVRSGSPRSADGWKPLGPGWSGFQALLDTLKRRAPEPKRSSPRKSRKAHDTREIRY